MTSFFDAIFFNPLYNALIFLIDIVPWGDIGIAIIILTLVVKIILMPLSHKSVRTQAVMRNLEPELKKIREKYASDKKKQAECTMELYKKHGVNPFGGCLLIIIQIPIILALYWVFLKGFEIQEDILYSFVAAPETHNTLFLGLIDMEKKSLLLALFAGISQYFQVRLSMPDTGEKGAASSSKSLNFQEEFAKSMRVQMKYGLPVFVAIIAYTISAAIALYWFVSNLFSIGHELYVRRKTEELCAAELKSKDDNAK
ncbi:YidC/Oxa1 family membrane protein insertase [bacterium]|nr:YidC/Oxa1 family membrane protein insertase [bacterium]MCI0566522.1 YidC/Oxa1 family membrane protein insertase [bacterium]MCI0680368.1 YidC/Oxa1 family membrane protein insertase [bacterium]